MSRLKALKKGCYGDHYNRVTKTEKEHFSKRLEAASSKFDFYKNSVLVKPISFKCILLRLGTE